MLAKELSTPVVTVDLDALEKNLKRVAELCRRQGVGLRPHTKTHKTVEVSRLQLAHGAVGLTVAKVGEAEVMAAAGLDDILVAFPIMGDEKLGRLARIARARRLLVSLDSEAAAQDFPGPPPRKMRASACWWNLTPVPAAAGLIPARRWWRWRKPLRSCRG